ncbi:MULTISPECIES: thioredoxin domain-containing protein [Streptacidiphilus]|uniref:Thioredoxin domain-containing protein n=2 Tax=Streptacidiphilus TaxID=228398 RepID=A0ABV6ULH2_9ACTN|nr:thioredoxin domain-containing protein [Streptacidiphilus jeojiense]
MKRSASKGKVPPVDGTKQDQVGAVSTGDTVRRSSTGRWVVAGIGVVAVFVAAGFVGALVRDHKAKTLSPPTTATGTKNLAVPVWGHAAVTLTVYEDMRDPASLAFAQQYDATLAQLVGSGAANVEYRELTGADAAHGGTGSLQAGNALGCAVDTSVDDFGKYRKVLLENQPADPTDDAYASNSKLISLARKVKALDTDVFRSCVDKGNHKVWVEDSQKDFTAAGYSGAPVLTMTTSGEASPAVPTVLIGNGAKATQQQLIDTVINAAKAAPLPSGAAVVTAPSSTGSADPSAGAAPSVPASASASPSAP